MSHEIESIPGPPAMPTLPEPRKLWFVPEIWVIANDETVFEAIGLTPELAWVNVAAVRGRTVFDADSDPWIAKLKEQGYKPVLARLELKR